MQHTIYSHSMLQGKKICLIGAGNIAEALVSGLLKGQVVQPSQIFATDVLSERLEVFERQYKVRVGSNNQKAAAWGDIVILAIKPQAIDEVLYELSLPFKEDRLVLSVAAGVPISRILAILHRQTRVVRAMPNTPSTVLEGATGLAGGPGVSSIQLQMAQAIFESVGKVVVVDESLMDSVTGLSGGGPAYVFVLIEALADGGVKMGLSRSDAQLLAAQTVLGAAKMVLESGEHPGALKDRVASPGGTTIAGLHKIEEGRLRATIMNAVESATLRSKELGHRILGKAPAHSKSRERTRRPSLARRRNRL